MSYYLQVYVLILLHNWILKQIEDSFSKYVIKLFFGGKLKNEFTCITNELQEDYHDRLNSEDLHYITNLL